MEEQDRIKTIDKLTAYLEKEMAGRTVADIFSISNISRNNFRNYLERNLYLPHKFMAMYEKGRRPNHHDFNYCLYVMLMELQLGQHEIDSLREHLLNVVKHSPSQEWLQE